LEEVATPRHQEKIWRMVGLSPSKSTADGDTVVPVA
jgi:hypothetical protein